MRILFAAGGTGGHLRPALATADEIVRRSPTSSILFLTTGRGIDERFLAGHGFGGVPLFPGMTGAPSRYDLFGWARAWRIARGVFRDFEPDAIVGFGGYTTLLGGVATLGSPLVAMFRSIRGRRAAIPIVLLEQNASPGRAVRMLARSADAILLTHDDAGKHLSTRVTTETIGNPLPNEILEPRPAVDADRYRLGPGSVTILVLGGSQGARGVNRLVLDARERLASDHPDVRIVMVTGDVDYSMVADRLRQEPNPSTVALRFESDMRPLYQLADIVVARAGGTTLAELAIVGRPMVLVPYPHHKDQHQLHNARLFEQVGGARIVQEKRATSDDLIAALCDWIVDRHARETAGRATATLGRPDAAARAAESILQIARRRRS